MENNVKRYRYLYGASVQGIQGFIFQTNALKDIVGASELVENICTGLFARQLGRQGSHDELVGQLESDKNAIVNAAGNIKYVFETREECEKAVRTFPKKVMEYAPGITISQSVVAFVDGDFDKAVRKLENNLRVQRNKPMRDTGLGLMGIERSRQTGLPVTEVLEGDIHLDAGTYRKLYTRIGGKRVERKNTTQKLCRKAFGEMYDPRKVAFDVDKITGKNDWIAIIHADGNGLGQVIQQKGTDPVEFKKFSRLLSRATREAAVEAFKTVMKMDDINIDPSGGEMKPFPMRPVVLSGDDHTVICRANMAVPYTEAFIKNFEEKTEKLLGGMLQGIFTGGETKLTACAGIAFIKSSYPFYYGYRLAESLCDRAKKNTKKIYGFDNGYLPASCLMFHKVQDSFVASYEDIVSRELTPAKNHSFEFGPYYIFRDKKDTAVNKIEEEGKWTVEYLCNKSKQLTNKEMISIRSGLRQWMSLMYIDSEMALQRMIRLKSISSQNGQEYIEEICECNSPYPVYDILTIDTINTQQTNKKEDSNGNDNKI